MYSLMIVDNRKTVVNSVGNAFLSEKTNITLLESTQNAAYALDMMRDTVPDIAVINLDMPASAGKELISKMRLLGYRTRIIALTAHSVPKDKKALSSFEISLFLPKSAHITDIKNAVYEIICELDKKKITVLSEKKIDAMLTRNLPVLRERYLENLLKSPSADPSEIESNIEFFNFDFKGDSYRVVIAHSDTKEADTAKTQRTYLRITNDMCNLLGIDNTYINFIEGYAVFITSITESKRLFSLLPPALRSWNKTYGLNIYLGISSECKDYASLNKHYTEALECLNYKSGWPEFSPIFFEDIMYTRILAPTNQLYDRQKLINGIKSRDKGSIMECINTFRIEIAAYPYMPTELIKSICVELIYTSISTALQIGEAIPAPYNSENHFLVLFNSAETTDRMFEIIDEFFKVLLKHIADKQTRRIKQITNQMFDYIEDNYMNNDISLTTLSRQFYVSRNYLSAIFKQETNMSFREYLTDFRMKKAYYLLQENKYTVSAVSNMVGYKKVDYFRNLYQKYYGKNPSEE